MSSKLEIVMGLPLCKAGKLEAVRPRAKRRAALAGTIGYEILTSLGARYARRHLGGG